MYVITAAILRQTYGQDGKLGMDIIKIIRKWRIMGNRTKNFFIIQYNIVLSFQVLLQ